MNVLGSLTTDKPRVKKDQQDAAGSIGGDYLLPNLSVSLSLLSFCFFLSPYLTFNAKLNSYCWLQYRFNICTLIRAEASLSNQIVTSLPTEDNIPIRKAEKHIHLLQNKNTIPIRVVILHLVVLHLCILFSTWIFYHLLDLWFAIADWSQSPWGNGSITFHRPTATCATFHRVCNSTADQYHKSRTEKTDLEWPDLYLWIVVLLLPLIWGYTAPVVVPPPPSGVLRVTISQTEDLGLPVMLPAVWIYFSCCSFWSIQTGL